MSEDSAFAVAMRANLDQTRPHVMEFMRINPLEEIVALLERYRVMAKSENAATVLDALLAAYGLKTAILEYEEQVQMGGSA